MIGHQGSHDLVNYSWGRNQSQVTALEAENFKHPDYDYELEIGSFTA